ncbi:MAG: hypothetical protein Wins2KO_04180 [Winogradskyella sp.]
MKKVTSNINPLTIKLIIVAVILYFISSISKSAKTIFSNTDDLDEDDKLDVNTSDLTISDNDSNVIANALYDAMVQAGTDEDLIYEQLSRLNSQSDFDKVFNRFGLRKYILQTGTNPIWNFYEKYNLIQMLRNELDDSEIQYIIETYPHLSIF